MSVEIVMGHAAFSASVDSLAEAIAARVAQILGASKSRTAPLSRAAAAEYCGLTVRTFDRERKRLASELAPMAATGPLSRRWSRDALDLYLFSGGRLNQTRRGRPRKSAQT